MRVSYRWWLRALVCLFFMAVGSGCIQIVDGGECQSGADCVSLRGPDWICLQRGSSKARECVATGSIRACDTDAECKSGEVCVGKTCRIQSICQCQTDSECAKNFLCIDCRCTTPSTGCKADDDCTKIKPGLICNAAGNCATKTATKCTANNQCKAGDVCVNGGCLLYTCALGKPCQADYMCIKDACIKNQTCECHNGTECEQNQVCAECRCLQGTHFQVVPEGDLCDIDEPSSGTKKRICTSVFKCTRLNDKAKSERCVRPCRLDKPEDCGHKEKLTCTPLTNGQGYCLQQGCSKSADCFFSGVSCLDYFDKKVCLP